MGMEHTQRQFDRLPEQFNLTYTLFSDEARECTGISGCIESPNLLTQAQVDAVTLAFSTLDRGHMNKEDTPMTTTAQLRALPHRAAAPAPPLSEDDARQQARLLKALADETRLRIISLLHRHSGDISVFEIVEVFELEQPTISHHLRILRDAGIVDFRKAGLYCYYFIKPTMLHKAITAIQQAGGLV